MTLFCFCLRVVEQGGGGEPLSQQVGKSHVDASDGHIAMRGLVEQAFEALYEETCRIRAAFQFAAAAGPIACGMRAKQACAMPAFERFRRIPRSFLARVAHRKRDSLCYQAVLDQFEHAGIHHFPQDHARFLERVVGREDLTVHKRTAFRLVCLDFRDGARLLAPSVVDKVFGVHAELPAEHFGVQGGHAGKVLRAVACQTTRDARPDAPDVRDRAVKPDLLERAFV